ncbi:MAG: cobalt-precorrin-6A reductase [Ruegeria sp.]
MSHLLILGGTAEANVLAKAAADNGINATYSSAGRVANPRNQPIPTRVGGFGGVGGLARYIREHNVSHIVDVTHPFAAQMSRNAIAASAQTGTPLVALTRPAWAPQDGDRWRHVSDIPTAVAALDEEPKRVFLAVGRMHLNDFATQSQHHILLRLVDEPGALPFPNCEVVVSRGPSTVEGDTALMQRHRTELIVSKNAGGEGARAKLDAARALGLPVLMIDRPVLPPRTERTSVAQVLNWLAHSGVNLGV